MRPSVIVRGNSVLIYKSRRLTNSERRKYPGALEWQDKIKVLFSQGKPKIEVSSAPIQPLGMEVSGCEV